MGVSQSVYIGPYVRLEMAATTRDQVIASCTNESCKQHGRRVHSKFCPDCGAKVDDVTITVNAVVGFNDFLESVDYEHEDELWMPEYLGGTGEQILLCNYGDYHFYEDSLVRSLADVNEQLATEMTIFNERHKVLLEKMQKFFGDKMSVHYGVCSYYS